MLLRSWIKDRAFGNLRKHKESNKIWIQRVFFKKKRLKSISSAVLQVISVENWSIFTFEQIQFGHFQCSPTSFYRLVLTAKRLSHQYRGNVSKKTKQRK